ncbi:BlaI/MecI/CopY family transcriptional regulator [Streptomyces sp. HC307]|uniref:BlaI/MecI/CopY family transcriptional regulator n=1 Tax=Streptomyces flavusporus TaxID=3385496 RepID=UPI003916FDBA
MSENTTASDLAAQYTAQVNSDLERNLNEQERIGTEIAVLQDQLTTLQRDHTVLVSMQQALGTTPSPAQTPQPARPAPTPAAAVPAPRKKAASGAGSTTRGKKATTTSGRAKTGKPAAGTTGKAPAAAAKQAQPTLIDLVRDHLGEQSEPRSAAEIATALGQTHPERPIKATVVRTTLENLVAKGHAQRNKQGTSVFYTAPDTPDQTSKAPSSKQSPDQTEAQPDHGA